MAKVKSLIKDCHDETYLEVVDKKALEKLIEIGDYSDKAFNKIIIAKVLCKDLQGEKLETLNKLKVASCFSEDEEKLILLVDATKTKIDQLKEVLGGA